MTGKLLHNLAQHQATLLKVCFSIYQKRQLIKRYNPTQSYFGIDVDLALPYISDLLNTDTPTNYIITPQFLVLGMIRDHFSDQTLIVGPIRIGILPNDSVSKLLATGVFPDDFRQPEQLQALLDRIPIMNLTQIYGLLSSLYIGINHAFLPIEAIISSTSSDQSNFDVTEDLVALRQQNYYEESSHRNPHAYEEEMLFYIRHGMTAELMKMSEKADSNMVGRLGLDTLRHFKNSVLIMNTLAIRAAISGGLPADLAYQIGELNIQQIESATSVIQLAKMSQSIKLDFCNRVRNHRYLHTDDSLANRAIDYIEKNIHKKITAKEIAQELGISPGYLSVRFQNAFKRSLPQYINEQKIDIAKKMLVYTEKSLADISEYLSFSSQSHFQNTFKKITGQTPLEYKSSESAYFYSDRRS